MNAPLMLTPNQVGEVAHAVDTASLLLNPVYFQQLDSFATMMASGVATVPKHLRGNKADCMAVTLQAMQWRKNPFGVAQKTHLVNGTLGYESQLIIAIVNTSGAIVGSLEFEWEGDWGLVIGQFKEVVSKKKVNEDTGEALVYRVPSWKMEDEQGLAVTCRAALRNSPGRVREMKLLLTQARTRNSTLWADDPKMQLAYLCGKKWARLNCPEVILGMYSPDELEGSSTQPPDPKDMGVAEVVTTASPQPLSDEEVAAWKAEAAKGVVASRAWFAVLPPPRRKLVPDATKAEVWAIAEAADRRRTVDAGSRQSNGDAAPAVDPFVADMQRAEDAMAAGKDGAP